MIVANRRMNKQNDQQTKESNVNESEQWENKTHVIGTYRKKNMEKKQHWTTKWLKEEERKEKNQQFTRYTVEHKSHDRLNEIKKGNNNYWVVQQQQEKKQIRIIAKNLNN